MKIRSGTIGKGTLPVLAAAFLCTGTPAQIVPGGYTCSGSASFTRTNNLSFEITVTNPTCTLPVEMAHWFNLATDPGFAGQYATLKCVDFSMWGTANPAPQLITVRVFQDLTPLASDDGCDNQVAGYDGANEPGPDLASALLLGEEEVFIPIGINPGTGPRGDGDFSVELTGPQGGGILLFPNIAFFVVVAHAGEAITQFGANSAGEFGDGTTGAPGGFTGGPEQTWVRPFNCTVGGSVCSQTGDWMKAALYYTALDFVMVLHMDLNDTRDPLPLRFDCRQDIAPLVLNEFGNVVGLGDRQVNVSDLLALLGSWGQIAPPRPRGDIAPCITPGIDCLGDNQVNVSDLLALLAAWGPCPNLVKDCETATEGGNQAAQISEGTFPWSIAVGLLESTVTRPGTDDSDDFLAGGVGQCGWANYDVSNNLINGSGTAGGFIWGDTFGIFSGNFNTGGGTVDPVIVGGDVWFEYTAGCNGRVFISATSGGESGEVADTILEVYPGDTCPTSWTEVLLCDDSSSLDPLGDFAEVDFNVLEGEKFLIRIAGWLGETGTGDLNISCVDNSFCPSALPVLVNGFSVSASTINAGISSPPNCPFTQDVGGRWFVVVGDGSTLTASTCQTEAVELAGGQSNLFDSIISVYCGTEGEVCADLTCVASSNASTCNLHQEVSWCTTFGQEYYILIHGIDGGSGPPFFSEGFFILDVTTESIPCATALVCGVGRPFNDKCEDAFEMVYGPIEEGPTDVFVSKVNTPRLLPGNAPRHNNINALTDGPLPPPGCTFINQDVWYTFTPDFTSSVVVDTCAFGESPVNVDTAIEIYIADFTECPPVPDSLGALSGFVECQNNGDGTGGGTACPGGSQFTTPILVFANQKILIRLGSNGGDKEGFYTLQVTATVIESECAEDPINQDTCPGGGDLEGGGSGELLLASPPYTTLDISGIGGGGTFATGDTVEGVDSGATGVIIALQTIAGFDILMLDTVSGAFSAIEDVTNGDPLIPDILTDATATADVVTNFTESFIPIDITNGGCNMCAPQLFDSLVPELFEPDPEEPQAEDIIVCGQISTYVSDADLDCADGLDGVQYELRDTDWYEFVVPEFINPDFGGFVMRGAEVTIRFESEFSASFGFTKAICGATPGDQVPFLASTITGGLCTEFTLTAFLDTGTYYVVVTALSISGLDVGGSHEGHDYILTMEPLKEGLFFADNDECESAFVITSNSSTIADNRSATNNLSDPSECSDGGFGPGGISGNRTLASYGTIWYKFEATTPTALVTTGNTVEAPSGANTDNNLVIWPAGPIIPCILGEEVGCGEDEVGFLAEVNLSDLVVGKDYYIMMGAWWTSNQSVYLLEISSPDPGP